MALLETIKLNASYGDFRALTDVSLVICDGEVLSIVGANSAGKSTLIRSISGETYINGGEILFGGKNIVGLNVHEIARLGIVQVPEGRRIFPLMTVKENLLVASALPGAKRGRVDSLQRAFELFPVLCSRTEQLGGTLSGGEQQMLAIARGLMALPKLLMLDEPSVGLAPIIVNNIFKVIEQINKGGITILLVEQNVKKSLSIASRAYVLEHGRIVMGDTGEALLRNPQVKESYLGL